jgi:hypothetical protein
MKNPPEMSLDLEARFRSLENAVRDAVALLPPLHGLEQPVIDAYAMTGALHGVVTELAHVKFTLRRSHE